MFSLFKNIFSSAETTTKIVDGVVSAADKLWFTDEEKADMNQKTQAWFLEYLKATQPQNLARRLIAMVISFLWAFVIIVGIFAYLFDREFSEFVFKVLSEAVNAPFSIIVGFYFGGHAIEKLIGAAKK